MSSQELVRREAAPLESVENAKAALAEMQDPADLNDVRLRASVFEAYAQANGAKEAAQDAAEIRLWAERRAGELRAGLPAVQGAQRPRIDLGLAQSLREEGLTFAKIAERLGVSHATVSNWARKGWSSNYRERSPKRLFDDEFGVSATVAVRWCEVAKIPERQFKKILREIRAEDRFLSVHVVLAKYNRRETSIERGISRLPDGRLRVRARRDHREYNRILDTDDLDKARAVRAEMRGLVSKPKPQAFSSIDAARQTLVRVEATISLELPTVDPGTRKELHEALAHVHAAEDALVRAINNESIARSRPSAK